MKTSVSTKLNSSHLTIEESDIIGNVVVKPRRMAKLMIGMYESTMPVPKFRLKFEPAITDAVDASLLRFDGDDYYTLVYNFQNFSESAVKVTVECE